jgi:hypothetical protein
MIKQFDDDRQDKHQKRGEATAEVCPLGLPLYSSSNGNLGLRWCE